MSSQPGPLSTEQLFRAHGPFVERFLARLGVPAEHAEDALQEVFLVVHRNGGYRPGLAKPTSYLAGIAIHAAHRHRRRERVSRARHTDASTELMPSGAADPTRALVAHEELERLQLALERLPEELRTTLMLVDVEGESCLSVAAALRVPVGTVYSRLHVARKKLQLALTALDARRARPLARGRRPSQDAAAPGFGLLAWLGLDRAFERSQAGQLLQLARSQPSAASPGEARLSRLHELLRAGADAPLAGLVPQPVGWLSVLGPTGLGALASLGAAAAAGVWLTVHAPHREAAPSALAQPTAARDVSAGEQPGDDEPHAPADQAANSGETERAADARSTTASSGTEPSASEPGEALQPPGARASSPAADRSRRGPPQRPAAMGGSARPRETAPAPAAVDGSAASRRAEPTPAPAAVDGSATSRRAEPTPAPAANGSSAALTGRARRTAAAPASTDSTPEDGHAPPTARPAASRTPDDNALLEMQQLASAERMLASAPARTLSIVQRLRERFPDSYLREESAYLELMALHGLGREREAEQRARAFLRAYPSGPYAARVRSVAESVAP